MKIEIGQLNIQVRFVPLQRNVVLMQKIEIKNYKKHKIKEEEEEDRKREKEDNRRERKYQRGR